MVSPWQPPEPAAVVPSIGQFDCLGRLWVQQCVKRWSNTYIPFP